MIKVTQFHAHHGRTGELPNETSKTFADLVQLSLRIPGTVVEIKFTDGSYFKAVSE